MKILIVANGFSGSTLPLANHLNKLGHNIKCFYIINRGAKCIESIDFDKESLINISGANKLSLCNRLYQYLNKRIDVYLMPLLKRRKRMEKVFIGHIITLINKYLLDKYINQIIIGNPDVVNIIIHTQYEVKIANALKKAGIPFVITFHEVLKNLVTAIQLKDVVVNSIGLNQPIICHSQKTASDLLELSKEKDLTSNVHVINFGMFESYLSYADGLMPINIQERYLLYIGHIHPYKGLKYLYESANMLDLESLNIRIVVAGGGYDPIITKMRSDKNFVVINHFIDNAELVGLIRNSIALVCPYISASQSGLVQTAMVFNKPVIATKVGAFEEVIEHGINGILCEPANASSLAKAINKVFELDNNKFSYNISEKLNWNFISNEYISIFNSIKKG